jgi:hypothetical protein
MKLIALLTGTRMAVACLAVAQTTPAPSMPPRTIGTIASVDGQNLKLKTDSDVVTVTLVPDARVVERRAARLSDVKPNQFIGVTATESKGGTLQATEIHIIPEAMRGIGEGHYPMGGGGATMTNGNVTSMTNGNVAQSGTTAGDGLMLQIAYAGGRSEIAVGPDVPVTVMSVVDRSILKEGRHVTVLGPKSTDGTVTATIVLVDQAP